MKKKVAVIKPRAVRKEYDEIGVDSYYIKHSKDYINPHEEIIGRLLEFAEDKKYIGEKVLDLCCGSGEVTCALQKYNHEVVGADPYTMDAYNKRVGKMPIELTFDDIIFGKLEKEFDCIICSFAMHLCEESKLPALLWKLGEIANTLIIITPHKRPDCDNISGWLLVDEIKLDRVRMRVYVR
jgi:SAM-dependent methyltransferase